MCSLCPLLDGCVTVPASLAPLEVTNDDDSCCSVKECVVCIYSVCAHIGPLTCNRDCRSDEC